MENENNQRKKLVEKEIFPFLAKKTNLPHRPMPRSFKTNGPFHLKEPTCFMHCYDTYNSYIDAIKPSESVYYFIFICIIFSI